MAQALKVVKITSAGDTVIVGFSCVVAQITFLCSNAGTAFTLSFVSVGGDNNILVAPITLTIPSNGLPIILPPEPWDPPIVMNGGIKAVTGGTPGRVDVWVSAKGVNEA